MRIVKISITLSLLGLIACKPQSESREHMDFVSNRMSDSILNLLDSGIALPAKTLAGTGSPIASAASSFTPIAQSK